MLSWIVEGLALTLALVGFLVAVALDAIDVPHHLWGAPRKNGKDTSQEASTIRAIIVGDAVQTAPQDQPE